MKSKVYFTSEITEEAVLKLFKYFNKTLKGNVAIKLHSGEEGNQNFLRPEFLRPIIDYVNGTVVECNTAYEGARNSTEKHLVTIHKHGWDKYFKFDLMDAKGPDLEVEIPAGKVIKKDYLGRDIVKYDSMLVLSHFKGHPMGGYGGALKQLSIGCASSDGKAYIHSGGKQKTQNGLWENICSQDEFLESMADAASAVVNFFKGNIIYINIMKNMSVDCDCCAVAEDPCLKDMGIMISDDPVAIDRACIDKVLSSNDPGVAHFMERVNTRHGTHTIDAAEALGIGSKDYELIDVTEDLK